MKRIQTLLLIVLAPVLLQAQGTFQNLNFEQATIVPLGGSNPNLYSAASAMPGWIVYIGSSPVSSVLYDDLSLSGLAVSIHDPLSAIQPLQGNYSVILQSSSFGTPTSVAIGQTGQLPVNAVSITFDAAFSQNLQVTFAGSPISLVQLGSTANYSILGGNISAYAGQTGELLFTAGTSSGIELDNIQFSTQLVPEPSALGLFTLSGLFLGWRWRRTSRTLPNYTDQHHNEHHRF